MISKLPEMIIFEGPFGSGKTTQAESVMDFMKANGYKCFILSLGGDQNIAKVINKFLLLLNIFTYFTYEDGTKAKVAHIKRIKILYEIWPIIKFLSILPYLIQACLASLFGYVVVADQFIFHFISMLRAYYGYFGECPLSVLKIVTRISLCFIPKKSIIFVLCGDSDQLKDRIVRRGSTSMEPSSTFSYYEKTPLFLCQIYRNCFSIDTTQNSCAQVFEEIKRFSEKYAKLANGFLREQTKWL